MPSCYSCELSMSMTKACHPHVSHPLHPRSEDLSWRHSLKSKPALCTVGLISTLSVVSQGQRWLLRSNHSWEEAGPWVNSLCYDLTVPCCSNSSNGNPSCEIALWLLQTSVCGVVMWSCQTREWLRSLQSPIPLGLTPPLVSACSSS